MIQKGHKTTALLFSTGRNVKHAICPRSAQAWISCQDFYLDEPERIYNNCLIFFFLWVNMLNVLYIPEALRHNYMPLLPGWTRKDIEQLPYFFLRVEMLNMLYILEAHRHKYHARTSTWMNQKGYRTNAYLFIYSSFFFFFSTRRNAKRVLYPRGAQA